MDLIAAVDDLRSHGVEVSDPFHFGPEGQTPSRDACTCLE